MKWLLGLSASGAKSLSKQSCVFPKGVGLFFRGGMKSSSFCPPRFFLHLFVYLSLASVFMVPNYPGSLAFNFWYLLQRFPSLFIAINLYATSCFWIELASFFFSIVECVPRMRDETRWEVYNKNSRVSFGAEIIWEINGANYDINGPKRNSHTCVWNRHLKIGKPLKDCSTRLIP